MIYICFTKKSLICLKIDVAKQTGSTKVTMPGLKVMEFFRKICVCHMAA